MNPVPVILDTDIGTDIDDSWAIAYLLRRPELDLQLLTTATGDTPYRAALTTRILKAAGRCDVPIAAGRVTPGFDHHLTHIIPYTESALYRPGEAVEIMAETIRCAKGPVTLLAIGPLTNLADLWKCEPALTAKIDLVAMAGSYKIGYDGNPGPVAEYNVVRDIEASQIVFNRAKWHSFTITPLDSCGNIFLDSATFRKLERANEMMREVCFENRVWWRGKEPEKTSCLYDTVAVHLAASQSDFQMETANLFCDGNGVLRTAETGHPVAVAAGWRDQEHFYRELTERLAAPQHNA